MNQEEREMSETYVGIDVGGTNIKIGLFDSELKLICKTSITTNANMGPEIVINNMARTVEELIAEAGLSLQDVVSTGIGPPGPAKYSEGIIIRSTNMPKFKNVPICRMLNEKLGAPVVFDNDANVACWGEYTAGAGKGVKDIVFFTLGTGIGGGIVSNGELLHGGDENGAEKGKITSKDVYTHLAKGDKLAKEITDGTAKALAITCINMLHSTEPKRIIFTGGMIAAGDALLNRIKYFFDEHIWTLKKETVEICFATLGEDTGIIGAAALARHTKQQGRLK